ncbi:MAG: PQQ-binding-like beta-propeller repeat protein [Planctomycetales bacterium]|nr:PQQ-binding-like beta-propeller repeat protein [Planctomycetales bacterium]
MKLTSQFLITLLTVYLWCSATHAAEGWTRFRGPGGQGVSSGADVPVHFSMEENVIWKTPIEGQGWSSPVVDSGMIWLTTAIVQEATAEQKALRLADDPLKDMKDVAAAIELKAVAIDFASGRIVHEIPLSHIQDPDPINPLNTFASPTPVIAEGRVICHFGCYGTWCLDAKTGTSIWQRVFKVDHSVGPGSSPVVVDDKVILVCDGIDEQFVAAIALSTGQELWRTPRPPKDAANVEFHKAYCTPITVTTNGNTQIVVPSAQWICAYDPNNGHELWRIDHGDGFSNSPSAITTANGLVVFSTGYMRPEMVAVRIDGSGDVTKTHVAWRSSRGAPTKPTPLAVGEAIYMISDNGILSKLRTEDGSIVWQERISGNFSASPINVEGKLFLCSHEGVVTVVGVANDYLELAKNQLESRIMATPAVEGNSLIVRTEFHLLRIGLGETK